MQTQAPSDYDLVIVGGGIHGVGTAQLAAAQGYSVHLLEKAQLGWATSSRSSKLIHGGLRYLESLQFSVVRESLQARAMLLETAPELVTLKPFYIPVYRDSKRSSTRIYTGLWLYRLLDEFRKSSKFITIQPENFDAATGINKDNLVNVFQYYDAQTDDLALTRAVAASAEKLGARISCGTLVENIELKTDHCLIHTTRDGANHTIKCKCLINAAGPWVNDVIARTVPAMQPLPVELVQGTHIIIEKQVCEGIIYVESTIDGRAVFIMPWKQHTMVGTTETRFTGNPDMVEPLESEKDYLKKTFEHYFRKVNVKLIDSFAGIRVLPAGTGVVSSKSRETLFSLDRSWHPRLITIVGGKLTSYHINARKLLKHIHTFMPPRHPIVDLTTLRLHSPSS